MTFEEWMQKNNYSLSYIDELDAEFLMREAWNYQQASIDGLKDELHCVRAYNDILLKRIDLLEQRVRDLQGHDDLGYIDYKLAEAAHEALKQNENL